MVLQEQSFELVVEGVPYIVKATPFEFNSEIRYSVNYNGGDEHIFTWDSSIGRLTAIDSDAVEIPDDLEVEIAQKLQATNM